ncbi:hypothetical protein BH10ACI2_BH10ACI2_24490 [soil metagenome]
MKNFIRILFLSVILACGLAAAPSQVSAQRNGSPVVVYSSRDGRGNSQSFRTGSYRADRGQMADIGNDMAVSIWIANGYRVRLCEKEGRTGNGDGRCEDWGPGYHNLQNPNQASFIRVTGSGNGGGYNDGGWGGNNNGGYNGANNNGGYGNNNGSYNGNIRANGVTIFADTNFRGSDYFFGVGRYLAGAGQFGGLKNDDAGSVIVPRGYRVKLCEDEGTQASGSGRCEEYSEGRFNLRYNDKASYIEVQKAGFGWGNWGNNGNGNGNGSNNNYNRNLVVVFSDRNQNGTDQEFGVGTFRNDLGQLGRLRNDDAGSVYVPRGYRVKFCEGEGGGIGSGRCEEYGQGMHNLQYNDKASYIRVWRGN